MSRNIDAKYSDLFKQGVIARVKLSVMSMGPWWMNSVSMIFNFSECFTYHINLFFCFQRYLKVFGSLKKFILERLPLPMSVVYMM